MCVGLREDQEREETAPGASQQVYNIFSVRVLNIRLYLSAPFIFHTTVNNNLLGFHTERLYMTEFIQ